MPDNETPLNLPSQFTGRETEYQLLTKKLVDALYGKGSTIFIGGEAGIELFKFRRARYSGVFLCCW